MPVNRQVRPGYTKLWLLPVALLVALVLVSPVSAFVWLGPFPPGPPNQGGNPPPANESIPPIFDWTPPPSTGGTDVTTPPGPSVVTQGAPEPSTIIGGLIGAGMAIAIRIRRRPRNQR